MLTRRSATDLLAAINLADGSLRLARQLGFGGDAGRLESVTLRAIGVPDSFRDASIVAGRGALRALLLSSSAGQSLRPLVSHLAQRLTARAPHHLWLALVVREDGGEAVIATWGPEDGRTRVSALVLDPRRPLESDAETLLALAAAGGGTDTLIHARWREILGRDALSSRFYRALEQAVASLGDGARGNASAEARRELALLATSRLLFLSFLQSKGWLDGDADFLVRRFDASLAGNGDAHRRFLGPLFFGTLNTRASRRAAAARDFGRLPFLNGGLFARSSLESRNRGLTFRDEELAALFDTVLTRYRFTGREERADWSEAAIDPEMLGRAFESLMASRERRESGAYYTPHSLVARVSEAALEESLGSLGPEVRDSLLRGDPIPSGAQSSALATIGRLRLLDPACGSGAFLVHLLERLATALRAAGDSRPTSDLRRTVLTRSIFGVDINPMAVWLCELRLWLSVVIDLEIEDPMDVPPLPNLDRNVRVGDTLCGGASPGVGVVSESGRTATVRSRYARASGPRKTALARVLDAAERGASLREMDERISRLSLERKALVAAARGRDLFGGRRGALGGERPRLAELRAQVRSLRAARRAVAGGGALPFRFASHFADVLGDGGFDIVIGNPPWVRLHRIAADRREAYRREFRVFREAAWRRGARDAGAGAGFAAQVDLASLFAERGMELTRPGGILAMLLPIKLWRSLAGGGVRRLLAECNRLRLLEDWSEAPSSFDAAVYPSLVVAQRVERGPQRDFAWTLEPTTRTGPDDAIPSAAGKLRNSPTGDQVRVALHRRDLAITWPVTLAALSLDESPGAPWLLLPPDARVAFARLAAAGPPLVESRLGRPTLGVKCGCNAAFVVQCLGNGDPGNADPPNGNAEREYGNPRIASDGRSATIEMSMLRPVLRGEAVRRWRPSEGDERIVWTHDAEGRPLRALPPLASRWLGRWRSELARRSDARAGDAWWSVYRVEGAKGERPRVVWADVGRSPRACVLPAGSPWIPLNTCYVVSCNDDADAAAFAALLNSPLAAAWLGAVAEPARGGFRRFLAWTVARLPIPADWARAREILAPLGTRGVAGETISDEELLDAAIRAYRVRASTVRPLVEWTWR